MAGKKANVDEALLKVALGYQLAEVTEEYAEADGELKLVKRKKTKKDVPPDLKAVQMLLGGAGEGGLAALTDEELEAEKQRLLEKLKEKDGGRVALKTKTATKAAEKKTSKKKKTPTKKSAAKQ